ncbi:hypothetical protein EfmAA96_28110 [Enterococcus faecium]|nr:hypothetical protein EfmAA96_28110 [Enterococcus faecium]
MRDSGIVYYTKEIGKTKIEHLYKYRHHRLNERKLNHLVWHLLDQYESWHHIDPEPPEEVSGQLWHITIYNYISKRKISTAKIMLKSNHTISEVSLGLGFSDSSHFSRVFKKYAGVSPKQYQLGLVDNFTHHFP